MVTVSGAAHRGGVQATDPLTRGSNSGEVVVEWSTRAAGVGAGLPLLLTAVNGVPRDWLYPPYPEEHWSAEVQRLDSAAPGTSVVIRTDPQGWKLTPVAR